MLKFLKRSGITLLVLGGFFFGQSSPASILVSTNPFSAQDSYGLSPFWDWKTLETSHFRVTYPENLKTIATDSAKILEEVHSFLSPVLNWEPHYKTQVLVIDNSDVHNGLTAPAGRFGMIFWVTPPENWSKSGYYDDWLRSLVVHEYTHFLSLDPTRGIYTPLRYVFGDLLLPNLTWPLWMMEGLAVFMETRYTTAGRGRTAYYEMVLRSSFQEGVLGLSDFLTLDKLSGDNPYFPFGDHVYQFGYHLMNEVALHTKNESVFGLLSKRSSSRIPYLINSNLKHITGKTWYGFWLEFLTETKKRVQKQIQQIQSHPVTPTTLLTEQSHSLSNDSMGVAASPDGHWVAYNQVSTERRRGLYFKDLKTGKSEKVQDKLGGTGMKFTPDSKALIYSDLHQTGIYYLHSDLGVYFPETHSSHWLTQDLRARDPDISQDGKWVCFTLTENGVTGLAIAPLIEKQGDYELGQTEKIYMPSLYDHVGNPQFSIDGKQIYFTFHPNGKSQEDLMVYDRTTQQISSLVSDGNYNRYPVVDSQNHLYFISNRTGVDNLYRYQESGSQMVTNLVTGINFPTFGPIENGHSLLYANVFSYSGWNVSKIEKLEENLDPKELTIEAPPAPPIAKNSQPEPVETFIEYGNYSIFPSILPRIWTPLFLTDFQTFTFGAETFGFDVTNRHRYLLGGTYDTQTQSFDGLAIYSNRSLGAAINLIADQLTTTAYDDSNGLFFSKQVDASVSIAFPIPWTYSTLTPSLGFNVQRYYDYRIPSGGGSANLTNASTVIPSVDALLRYSNAETSTLAITTEAGRYTAFGARLYLEPNQQVWKPIFLDQEYFRLSPHVVLNPAFKASWVSQVTADSSSDLVGRYTQKILGLIPLASFPGNGFDQFSIRGYPGMGYSGRLTGVTSVDLWFPIARIFRGWGTNPIFAENLYGFAFGEGGYLNTGHSDYILPSAGAGVRLAVDLFYVIPVLFSLEYHHGFRSDLGGSPDIFFQISTGSLSF